jgi:hypothetical protein
MDKYDPRYKRGKIYTITCEDGAVYVGSTIQKLNDRLAIHINNDTCSMYQYIHNNYDGDWSKCKIELYENYPCKNKKVLDRKEGEITLLIGTINKLIAGRTRDEYEKYRKEDKKIYRKEHCIKNAEHYKKYRKEYYEKNKQEITEKLKQIIDCDCGGFCRRYNLARHKKSKIHQELMDKQTSKILLFLECF